MMAARKLGFPRVHIPISYEDTVTRAQSDVHLLHTAPPPDIRPEDLPIEQWRTERHEWLFLSFGRQPIINGQTSNAYKQEQFWLEEPDEVEW